MARPVNDAQVRAIIPGTSINDLAPFIATADALVNRLAASACGSDLTEPELEQIEIWLAAHFACVSDPSIGIVQQTVEGSSVTVSRGTAQSSDGIMSTQYGQMANSLSGGCLYQITLPKPTVCFF